MTPQEFIDEISEAAKQSAIKSKIPASFTIAEAALESGWGSSLLATKAFNLFGVKADKSWHGETLAMRTREFIDKEWKVVPALWRRYDNWQDCMDDHAQFLNPINNKLYAPAFEYSDGEGFAIAVANAGYATDPDYAEKLILIMRKYNLREYDV